MNLAIDVYYQQDKAHAVGIFFEKWEQAQPSKMISTLIGEVADYESGSFYKRELPCILELLKQVDLSLIDNIIVDGYVYLDDNKKGLGLYLYEAIGQQIPVIGVAKNYFRLTPAIAIFRGDSLKPLYITSVGIEPAVATKAILSMDGLYRFPTLLKYLDQQTKDPNAFLKITD